ncbi:helix-turn-helix transcriptional regulator [Micromonospora aurantiaca]|uniref:helix-turn-helix domain-containing protein n=1 Tax=Micromonospora aurantiaca (nom. illeg.) TaxID=47850 RepID=UPI00341E3393
MREVIAENVRVELARRRMSQRGLAEATGLSQSYIGRRLTGEMPFTTDDLELIATALSVPVTAFLPATARAA